MISLVSPFDFVSWDNLLRTKISAHFLIMGVASEYFRESFPVIFPTIRGKYKSVAGGITLFTIAYSTISTRFVTIDFFQFYPRKS